MITLNNNFKTLNQNVVEVKETVNTSIQHLTDVVEETKKTVKINEATLVQHNTGIFQNQVAIQHLQQENKELKERLIKLDSVQRRNQLIVDGIAESKNEEARDLYHKVCTELYPIFGEDVNRIPINYVERVGKYNDKSTRGVIVHFTCISDCELIMKQKHRLGKGIYVKQNFPPEIEERRSKLVPILKRAKSLPAYNRKSKLVGDKLVINSEIYSADEESLKKLPKDLDLVSTCQLSNEETLTFFGYASPFSNFHKSNFLLNGKAYTCVEQYIQSAKAEMFDDQESLNKIMKLTSPALMKNAGKRIKNYKHEQWISEAKSITKRGVMAKFTQNIDLQKQLIATGKKTIGEASTDKFWGIGISLNKASTLMHEQWIGDNTMGQILMEIRAELPKHFH